MNQEFTKIKSENVTRYILENGSGGATSGGTSSASVGGGSYAMPIGGIQRRKPGQNLISQEAKEKEAPKPRNFVAKNAKMGGAGQHRDKKKEIKQGVEKHKKPYAEDVTASSISSPHGPAAVAGAQRGGFAGLDAEMGDKADKETLAAYQIKIMNKQAELEIAKKLGGVPPKFGKDGTGIFSGMNALEFPKWLDAHPQYVDAILGITGTATPNKSKNRRSQTVNVPPVPTAGQTSMTDYKSTSEGHDDNGGEEYNDEVGMADSNIHTIIRSAKELINALEPMENMPEWAQDKLAQVKGMLVSVKDYVESQHEQGNIYHTNEGLGDEFSQFLKDKGIKHRVAGSPEQERQRTQDMMAQRAKDRANAPAPAAPSPEAIAQAKEKLAMLSKQFDPNYQYSDDHSFWTKQHQLAQQIDSLKKFISRGEVGVAEGAPELLKQEMPLVRHIERELAQHGYEKGTPEYNEVFKHTISMYRKFGNVDAIKQGVAEGKADYNFDIEDLKRLERIRDLPTLKTQALALISKPSVKPMKPEKVEWFKNALDNQRMNSPMKVIKLMYDLLLSGEGNAVVGTRSSMNPNSYRQRFGEQGVEEGWGMGGYATAIGSEIQPGKGHEMGENDEYDGEGSMIKNDLHTIVRVSTHLAKALTDDENLPTWVIEKIAQTKGMIVNVMDYMISQHEMGQVYQKENHPDEKEDKALIRKMVKQQALKQETNDPYMMELQARLAEKIPKNAPVKTYIDDFAKASKTPNAKGHHQFKNKSPEKVRQMAIAASYGAKNPSKKKK